MGSIRTSRCDQSASLPSCNTNTVAYYTYSVNGNKPSFYPLWQNCVTDWSWLSIDITHYTLYTIDSYTGNYIDKVNVTETSFTRNTTDEQSCPMYYITAWNSGGEGDMSVPVPPPHSKFTLGLELK